ncbi:MAG: hypothetical protein LBQ66_12050 [Planctomycetaceae bacterium]|nr:hypothetical protein [Planctomycetaceae bacterium]
MKSIFELISFRGKYFAAALVYFGFGLILMGVTPSAQPINAQFGCGGEITCPPGQNCCGDTCCTGTCSEGVCCSESDQQ